MDKKRMLNAKMKIAIIRCSFWIRVTELAQKMGHFLLRKTLKAQEKEIAILREMLKEDYPDACKNILKEILDMQEDLA